MGPGGWVHLIGEGPHYRWRARVRGRHGMRTSGKVGEKPWELGYIPKLPNPKNAIFPPKKVKILPESLFLLPESLFLLRGKFFLLPEKFLY